MNPAVARLSAISMVTMTALAAYSAGAHAQTLNGVSIRGALFSPSTATPYPVLNELATVGPGVEFLLDYGLVSWSADFEGLTLTLGLTSGAGVGWDATPGDLWIFSLPDGLRFTSVTETSDSIPNGASFLGFDADNIATFAVAERRYFATNGFNAAATYDLGISGIGACMKPSGVTSAIRTALGL